MIVFSEKIEFIGNTIRFSRYSKEQRCGFRTTGPGTKEGEQRPPASQEENRRRTLFRAQRRFFNLCALNFFELDKFLTLTFKNPMYSNRKIANPAFKNFIDKLRKTHDPLLKYIAAIELQERGTIHYHLLMKMEYIDFKLLLLKWGLGGCWIRQIPTDNPSTQKYTAKYVGKNLESENVQTKTEKHNKLFLHSRNLKNTYPAYRGKKGEISSNIGEVKGAFDRRFKIEDLSCYRGQNEYLGLYEVQEITLSRKKTDIKSVEALASDYFDVTNGDQRFSQ